MSFIDVDRLNQLLCGRLKDVLTHYFPDGTVKDGEFIVRNHARGDRKAGSFKYNIRSHKWSDFATAESGIYPIGFISCGMGWGFVHAIRQISQDFGFTSEVVKEGGTSSPSDFDYFDGGSDRTISAKTSDPCQGWQGARWASEGGEGQHYTQNRYYIKAGLLWCGSETVGEAGEAYLASRHLTPQNFSEMRYTSCYHSDYGYDLDCLVLPVRSLAGSFQAVQRIFIHPENPSDYGSFQGDRKKTLGSIKGGAVKLGGIKGTHIIVCEGPEDAMSLYQYGPMFDTGWCNRHGDGSVVPVWAVLGKAGFLNCLYPEGAFIEIVLDRDSFKTEKQREAHDKFMKKLMERMEERENGGGGGYDIRMVQGNHKDQNAYLCDLLNRKPSLSWLKAA